MYADPVSRTKPNQRMHGWNVVFYQKRYLGILEWQSGIDMHSVQIIEGTFKGIRHLWFKDVELILPPLIRFQGYQNVGLPLFYQVYKAVCLSVGSQNIGRNDA